MSGIQGSDPRLSSRSSLSNIYRSSLSKTIYEKSITQDDSFRARVSGFMKDS